MVPQDEAGIITQVAFGSGSPIATAWQLPWKPGKAQVLQVPQPAAMQQTPSAQLPLKHSSPDTHVAPLASRLVHTFDMQVNPVAQSPSPPQVVRHEFAPHA